jgi:hypothetical protein
MKKCQKCNIEKDSSEFGYDKYKSDGLNAYCKTCIRKRSLRQRESDPVGVREYADKYREKNREILRKKAWLTYYTDWDKRAEQGKQSYQRHKEVIAQKRAEKRRTAEEKEKNRQRQRKWREENRTAIGMQVSSWKKRNPQKAAAHTLVLWAIKSGFIKKQECCEQCGLMAKLEGHHEDYLKPLEVKWLCKSCHSKKHRKYR